VTPLLQDTIVAAQWFFLAYFVALNGGYILLNLVAYFASRDYAARRWTVALQRAFSGVEPPVSVLVPAYNEEATIATSVRSILQLEYPEYEVIVVNDGSRDSTLATLVREFALVPFPDAIRVEVPCRRIRGVYRSTLYRNLRVIDKENGGKADALNAGINGAHYPLFCAVDADSALQRDSLWRVVEPFLENPHAIAAGGTVRVANGCTVEGGFLTRVGLPANPLALLQIVEYLRAFLFGRLGWSPMNAVLVISGAFGLFRRSAVVGVGGYRSDTVGEDMELVVRLHRHHRLKRLPYRIVFVSEPICWTEAPETLAVLKNQRVRWQRGLSESLTMNRALLLHPRGGAPGWVAMPFMILFEWLSPLLELAGYLFVLAGWLAGAVAPAAAGAFLLVAVGFGVLLSVSALLLEEIDFRIYPRFRQVAALLAVAVAENFGYRQLMSWYRLVGLARWASGRQASWGKMTRSAAWQKKP
jgi:cellulose synthase/poly-beta-1,6-N-acetylglucosamine synthase-like glycosyltransferase